MDNKEYLEKIASEARPNKPATSGFLGKLGLSPLMKKLLIGGVVLAFLIIILGAALGGGGDKNSERDLVDKLSLRTTNLITSIEKYTGKVKSSSLRSMGNSLKAFLNQANYAINSSLTNDFGDTSGQPQKEQTGLDEETWAADLDAALEGARLNGILDRAYAREYAYQIGMLIDLENDTIKKTNKPDLKSALEKSVNDLDQLYPQFNNFSAE
ncbi:hypothetical protein IKF40_00060 [Candidatus Saccharibacteria bacterium]|nr:hypothetical protein [Candidatus Saccharibacteria bacterium]MBR2989319.1 hypothetical protein [Candidatus Saccharibacteria bacterium]